jgi:hypothetical protein
VHDPLAGVSKTKVHPGTRRVGTSECCPPLWRRSTTIRTGILGLLDQDVMHES